MRLLICGQTGGAISPNLNSERTLNLIPIVNKEDNTIALICPPGMSLFSDISGDPVRGLHVVSKSETTLYAVIGTGFYAILTDGSFVLKGTLGTNEGPVSISDNGLQIAIFDGTTTGYTYTLSTDTFATIGDADFPGAVTGCFIDGYTIINEPDSRNVMCSALYDTTSWNALDIDQADSDPDNILAVSSDTKGELWLFGALSTEVWYNAGYSVGFPFGRIQGGVLEAGLAAAKSLGSIDGRFYFLARLGKSGERVVVETQGLGFRVISTPEVNYQIGKMNMIGDAEGFCYLEEGRPIYILSFPTEERTFVYDVSTGLWHERGSTDANGVVKRWRARCHAFFNGHNIIGDCFTGRLYKIDNTLYTENGQYLHRIRRTQILKDRADQEPIYINELAVDMETGVGLLSGQGENPIMMLRLSRDGGITWGNEKHASMGARGEYGQQVRYYRLGRFTTGMIAEFKVTDPVKVVILGATIKAAK